MPRTRDLIDRPRTAHRRESNAAVATITVADRDVLGLEGENGRVRVFLVMPGIDRRVEVTGAPATAVHALEDAAARAGQNPSQVNARARAHLASVAERSGAWQSEEVTDLVRHLGGASYPMLAAAYTAGAGAISTVPRWADAILAAPDPRRGADRAFARRATRRVVAAFARTLIRAGDAPVDLSRLALALIGRDVLEPDRLATVLEAEGPAWQPSTLPSPRRLEQARSITRYWGADRTLGYLLQAATDDDARRFFEDCVDHALDLQSHAPIRLPASVSELREVYRLQIRTPVSAPEPVAPEPPRPTTTTRATGGAARRAAGRADSVDDVVEYGLMHAPSAPGAPAVEESTPIRHPAWLAPIDGASVGRFGFVLPRNVGELITWGRLLSNCIGDFGPAVVAGAAHLVGILDEGRLRYVVEIDPFRRIRQFSGRANRGVARANHDIIIDHLRTHGALR